jgi:hypothetical protein
MTEITLESAAAYFDQLGEAGSAVLYKICSPEASPADIAAALQQKLDKDGKPRSTDIRISGISQLIQAGFTVSASIPEGGLKPQVVRRSASGTSAAVASAKAEAEAAKAEAAEAVNAAEAAALATVTAAALAVLKATAGNTAALAGMPEAAVAAALEQWEAAQAEKRNADNAAAASLLADCAEAAGVEAAALLDWVKAAVKAQKKA